ncbi:MAG: DUF86 domain-containing protein [Selenomonadaceae bacterium]|nr:DUF86 domain-containing protein [Selenomonadaceae bacterium]
MRNENRIDKIVVQKLIEYCDQVTFLVRRFGSTAEVFNKDVAFQLSCGMCIVQIGELTNRLSEEFKNRHSKIPWRAIKSMRNIFVHEYEKIDFDRVWKNLTEDIPKLKEYLTKILLEMDNENENRIT